MDKDIDSVKDISSEAGIIASIILKPELTFYSENLTPNQFSNKQNAYIYYAVCQLAQKGIDKAVDAYSIVNILDMRFKRKSEGDFKFDAETLSGVTIEAVSEFVDSAKIIARETPEEYLVLVDKVIECAFRRDVFTKLISCENLCFSGTEKNLEQKIYDTLDNVMMSYSSNNEVPQYKDVVDDYFKEIEERQGDGISGMPFKFPTLNKYATIEPGELFIFAAEAKQGKSMILLNCAVDLLKQNKSVLYIDSELNSRMFTCRLVAHLAGIEFNRVKSGNYNETEEKRIHAAIEWIKTKKFTHVYMPMFDAKSIYTTVKKVKHTQGLDVLVVDYFKSGGDGDAFATYQELGKLVDMVKNKICGDMNIAGIGAAQATTSGRVADSAKIGRNASTIAIIQNKSPEEIEADGIDCGNKKLTVCLNRNGEQMAPNDYIDLKFNGNLISYEEAKQQHIPREPY